MIVKETLVLQYSISLICATVFSYLSYDLVRVIGSFNLHNTVQSSNDDMEMEVSFFLLLLS